MLLIIFYFLQLSYCLYENSQHVIVLNSENVRELVLQSKQPWYLNFGHDDCFSCSDFAKEYENAAKYMQGKVNFGYVDMRKQPSITNIFGISGENIIIFLNEDKPGPAGSPSLYNWKLTAEDLQSFAQNEKDTADIRTIYGLGAENLRILHSKADLDNYVMSSKDPWFLMFCTQSDPQKCNPALLQEYLASKSLKNICKFGYIDIMKTHDIVNHFGVSGNGIVIFLRENKPPPYGAPDMVQNNNRMGVQLIDYEKTAWNSFGSQTKPEENFEPKLEDLSRLHLEHGIMQKESTAFFILFYSNALHYQNQEVYKKWTQLMLEVKEKMMNNPKIQFGRYNVDNNRGLINYLNVWPIPNIVYFPLKHKGSDSIISYSQEFAPEVMQEWLAKQLREDENNQLRSVTQTNWRSLVLQSKEPWFILFYVNNFDWCIKCRFIQPVWKELSNQELIKNKVNIAKFNCENSMQMCQQLEAGQFPKMYYYPQGIKDPKTKVEYKHLIDPESLASWVSDQYIIGTLKTVIQLQNEEQFKQYCSQFNGFCFIAFLNSDQRNIDRSLIVLDKLVDKFKEKPVSFAWMVGGQQDEFEKQFRQIKEVEYPCMVGLNYKKDDQNGYKVSKGEFGFDELQGFVSGLLSYDRAFIPIRKEILFPQIKLKTHRDEDDL